MSTSQLDLNALSSAFEKLQMENLNDITSSDIISSYIKNFSSDQEILTLEIVQDNVLKTLLKALQSNSDVSKLKAAEFVAELAKVEEFRSACADKEIVDSLVSLLDSENPNVCVQACRALGNICYEHDGGRTCVTECGAVKKLISLMKRIVEKKDSEADCKLKIYASGFLLNLLNSYHVIKECEERSSIIDLIGLYLDKCIEEEEVVIHVISALTCIADDDEEECFPIVEKLASKVVKMLEHATSIEVMEASLELLTTLSETETLKLKLVESGVAEGVMRVIKSHLKEEVDTTQGVAKLAYDLIVLLLVADDSMELLYNEGKGKVYRELVDWISEERIDLRISAALAIGNFARSDHNCECMVEEGIHKLLLNNLKETQTDDGRLQHAVVSSIRNLSISSKTKPILIKEGVLQKMLTMLLESESLMVVYKVLAAIRLLSEGQQEAAQGICEDRKTIEKIVEWSKINHQGIESESTRTLAWLIRNCVMNIEIVKIFVQSKALKALIGMLASPHAIMVMEACWAVKLITDAGILAEMAEDIPQYLEWACFVIKNIKERHDIVCATLCSLKQFSTNENLSPLLKKKELKEACEEFYSNEVSCKICPDKQFLSVIS